MASILHWVVGKVSSTTNSALESVLRRIIIRFLEEPIADDAFALQLFEDWTMTIKLKRVFFDAKMVNNYVHFLIFRSIYFADFKFDARYNLSKFNIELSRTLLEIDLCEEVETAKIDENLNASIQEFTEQLPVKEEGGWKNWFLNKVKQILFKLDSLTVLLKSGSNLEDLKLIVQNVNYSYENEVMRAVIPSVAIQIGEKKTQKDVVAISQINFQLKNGIIEIIIDEIRVDIAENVIQTVFGVIDKVMRKLKDSPPAPADESNGETFVKGVSVTLKKVRIAASGIVISIAMLKLTFRDRLLSVEVGDADLMHGDVCILAFDHTMSKSLLLSVKLPKESEELSVFEAFPENNVFNALVVTLKLPILVLSITKDVIEDAMKIVSWIPRKDSPPAETVVSKSSCALSVSLPEALVRVGNVSLLINRLEGGLWISQTEEKSFTHARFKVGGAQFNTTPTFSLVKFCPGSSCSLSASVIQVSGGERMITVEGHCDPVLVRIPNSFEFIDHLRALVPSTESQTQSQRPQPTSIAFNVTVSRLSIDYMTISMPARAILVISRFFGKGNGKTHEKNWAIAAGTSAELYFSNMRENLPLMAFGLSSFPAKQLNFAHMVTVNVEPIEISVDDKKTIVNLQKVAASGGVCIDTMKVFIAFLMHIQYKLDNPPESQSPTRKFEMPDHLLQLTQTLTQSMNLAKLECKEEQSILVPNIYDSMQDLVASVKMEREDPVMSDDDGPPISIESGQPVSDESISITIGCIDLDFKIFGGRDLTEIWNLQPMAAIPKITNEKFVTDDDFEIVTNRDEFNFIQVVASGNAKISMYSDDPLVSMRVAFDLSTFQALDNIQNSVSRLLLGTEDTERTLNGVIDILTTTKARTELSLQLHLPNLAMFVTQEQIDFFIASADVSKVPRFPSDSVVDEPLAFQLFQLVPSNLHISAHFRLWLDIHLDDIDIQIPECSLFALRGFDGLIGALAEFYFAELSKPGAMAVVGGLPVVKNLRRITAAVRDLFAFDVQRYGVAEGLGKSFTALLQIVAMETLNAGANAASIAERFLSVAMKLFGGKKEDDTAMRNGVATLVVQSKKDGKLMRAIPSIVLAPGIISLQKLNEMMKAVRDKINPDLKKRMKYRKEGM